jgi:hypothetical protein
MDLFREATSENRDLSHVELIEWSIVWQKTYVAGRNFYWKNWIMSDNEGTELMEGWVTRNIERDTFCN